MKVLAVKSNRVYICEVSQTELEKFLNLYYGHLKTLKEGEEVDLGKGYNHAADIDSALRTTQQFIKDNRKIITAITNGLLITARSEDEEKADVC